MLGQEDEDGVTLRFLERLQQCVLRFVVHAIGFLDDEHLVRTLERRTRRLGDDRLPHDPNRDQWSFGNDVVDIGMMPPENPQALSALPATLTGRHLAVEGRGHGHRSRKLPGSRRSQEQPRVSNLAAGHLGAQTFRRLGSLEPVPDAHRGIGGPGGPRSRAKVAGGACFPARSP